MIHLLSIHSGLKGEIPEKNVSKDPSMDSISKIYFDLNKLWPKIWELDLFETLNSYYCSVKGKLAKILQLDYEVSKNGNQT